VDGDSNAVIRETNEETGLVITENKLVFRRELANPCKRSGGDHHLWEVYQAVSWNGELKKGSDAKQVFWASLEDVRKFAARTEHVMQKNNLHLNNIAELTKAVLNDEEWMAQMGLEPVWYYILKDIKLI